MEEIFSAVDAGDGVSINRCRELLGNEAVDLSDEEIDRIRCCAETVAQAVIEMFLDQKRPTIH